MIHDSRFTHHASRPISRWQRCPNLRILDGTMNPPASSLPAPQGKRTPTLRRGALKMAAIYLAFATVWIAFSDGVLSRISDKRRVLYVERIEDGAFALCTGVLLYALVMRFARQRAVIEDALRRNERR